MRSICSTYMLWGRGEQDEVTGEDRSRRGRRGQTEEWEGSKAGAGSDRCA
jgi:hypothetical protein